MPSYIQTVIAKNESLIYQGEISLWALLPLFFWGFVIVVPSLAFMALFSGLFFFYSLVLFFFGVQFWIYAAIYYLTTEIVITDKRIIVKEGWISRTTMEINLSNVETIQVDQGILGRIFNYGNLVLSGAGDPQSIISGIIDPLDFRRNVFEVQETGKGRGTP